MCDVVATQIAGSAYRRHWRGLPLTLRTEVSQLYSEDDNATYTWTVVSESSVAEGFSPLILTSGRNPRVLTIPAYSLGYAGSVYVLKVDLAGGMQNATSATATGLSLRRRHMIIPTNKAVVNKYVTPPHGGLNVSSSGACTRSSRPRRRFKTAFIR